QTSHAVRKPSNSLVTSICRAVRLMQLCDYWQNVSQGYFLLCPLRACGAHKRGMFAVFAGEACKNSKHTLKLACEAGENGGEREVKSPEENRKHLKTEHCLNEKCWRLAASTSLRFLLQYSTYSLQLK